MRAPRSISPWLSVTEVELPVEPVLVAADALLHGHVEQRLEQRDARHLVDTRADEAAARAPAYFFGSVSKRAASISLSISGFWYDMVLNTAFWPWKLQKKKYSG